jgi:hypothetical protein
VNHKGLQNASASFLDESDFAIKFRNSASPRRGGAITILIPSRVISGARFLNTESLSHLIVLIANP